MAVLISLIQPNYRKHSIIAFRLLTLLFFGFFSGCGSTSHARSRCKTRDSGRAARQVGGAFFAIVSRSDFGPPREGYLHQYRLVDDGTGTLRGLFARAFGTWSGKKEIEAIAVDQALGHVEFSDSLACFGTEGFADDREGISIHELDAKTGYVVVSNKQANTFRISPREGTATDPHAHPLITNVSLGTLDSVERELTMAELLEFPGGLLVAMSTDKTFHYYAWADIAKAAGSKVPE